jgi:DNA-binding MarR family transcriptional regulator
MEPATSPVDDTALAADLRLVIARLARRLRQLHAGGLTPSQLSALASVDRLGPVRLGDLAIAERIAAPTLTKIVGALEADGLLVRQADAGDRRVTRVAVTDEGRARLEHIQRERDAYLQRRVAELDPADRARLEAALPLLATFAREGDG